MERRRALKIASIALFCAAIATPCSFDTTPALALNVRPDFPIDDYVDGRLGVIQPTYARSHLVIAYRYMSGKTPSAAERAGFRDLLRFRLNEYPEPGERPDRVWRNARRLVRGDDSEPPRGRDRPANNYGWFVNCTDDAYATAAKILAARAKEFGVAHRGVRSWLDAQDAVFANCGSGEADVAPADPSLPPIFVADRAYQIAAADFYAMRYGLARAKFAAIARDPQSPWQQTARLVAARTLLRKATLSAASETYADDPDFLAIADRELHAILADPAAASIHEPVRALLAFVQFRTNPRQRFAEVVRGLTTGAPTATRARTDLGDYTALLDRDDVDFGAADDLTDWIHTVQASKSDHALDRWRATKKNHWLAAALMSATDDVPDELLDAAAHLGTQSPAYPTIAYHRARLLSTRGANDEARDELDRALALDDDHLPTSARNLLLELRRPLARSLDDYLRDAQPIPVGEVAEQRADEYDTPVLPTDAAGVFNQHMPLDMLAVAARAKTVHRSVRDPILVAAFTRALLFNRDDVAEELLPAIRDLYPTLAPRLAKWKSSQGDTRRFAAVDLIVHSAALRPYTIPLVGARPTAEDIVHMRDVDTNWWCRGGFGYWEVQYPDLYKPAPLKPPLFVSSNDAERNALRALGSGSTWMLRNTMTWSRARPKDPAVPEALALAVQGTRWGCADEETANLAKAAHTLLHARYPDSQWAKDTKYWYTGRH